MVVVFVHKPNKVISRGQLLSFFNINEIKNKNLVRKKVTLNCFEKWLTNTDIFKVL